MRRFVLGTVVAVVGLSLLPVTAGAADSVQAQLKSMQQRMSQMEQQLQQANQKISSQQDQLHQANQRIEGQQDLIQRAAIEKKSSSGLSSFLDTIQVDGWLAGSWMYRFPNPDGGYNSGPPGSYSSLAGANVGSGGFTDPLHPDANSFSLDQAWIGIGRPTTDENRAGFRLDMVMGKTAQILSGNTWFCPSCGYTDAGQPGGSFLEFNLFQAYIEYLAPVLPNGIRFQAGKMETWMGAEHVAAPQNFNITRGMVWAIFDPITNVGIRADADLGGGWDVGLGFVNGTRSSTQTDINSDKAVVGKVAYQGDTFGVKVTGTYGQSADSNRYAYYYQPFGQAPASEHEAIVDLLGTWNPTEKFSSYLDLVWMNSRNSQVSPASNTTGLGPGGIPGFIFPDDMTGYGVSAAGRYAITDRAGLALRAEWVDLQRTRLQNLRMYTLTTTADYKLTDHLTVKAEVRYDNGAGMNLHFAGGPDYADAFSSGKGNFNTDKQVTTGVEVLYNF